MELIIQNIGGEANKQWKWLFENAKHRTDWDLYFVRQCEDRYYWKVEIRDNNIALLFLLKWGEKVVYEEPK